MPCVLVGLSRAPQFIVTSPDLTPQSPSLQGEGGQDVPPIFCPPASVWANQIDAAIIPATACGSSALLSLSQLNVQIIAVEENQTQMQVPPEKLGIQAMRVNSYLEALGVLVAHRAGISVNALSPTLSSLRRLS